MARSMKILLLFPETTVFEDPMVFPPLGLFYLRAVLERAGHLVDFVDMSEYVAAPNGTRTKIYADPPSSGYDVYMVSGTSPQAREIRRLGKYLRERGCTTIVGGPHATNYAGAVTMSDAAAPSIFECAPLDIGMLANYHVLVKREGERAVLSALERLDEARECMAQHGRGIVIEEPVDDMASIPIPSRVDAERYRYYLDGDHGARHRATTMFSSRGCPQRCAFCDSPALFGRKVRYTPLESVEQELVQIRELGFSGIHFFDDILPLARERTAMMAQMLKRHGFIWRCFMRVDIMSHARYGKAFLQMLYDHGLREVLVGVESGDQRILDGIHKGTTVEQNTLVRQWCREIGIRFKASVIFGLPGEDQTSMEATLRWVLDNRPDRVNICTYIPFPGTPISKGTEAGRLRVYGDDAVHPYDLKVDIDDASLLDGGYFYAGSRDGLRAVTSTAALSRHQIQAFWQHACAEVKAAGIPY